MNRSIEIETLGKRILATFFCSLCLLAFTSQAWSKSAETEATYKNLEIFSNILNIIQQNYVEEVDTQKVLEGAIKGMLATLDPHSSFMKPDHFKELQVETTGSFSGIGIEIAMRDNILTVVSPIEGTPAYKKGLMAGDRIMMIEGESTKDMTLMEAVKKLRGKKGTEVTISLHRQGWSEFKEVTLVRDVIPLHSIRAKRLGEGFGYVRITNFQAKTTRDLKQALDTLTTEQEMKGLVLDLRNNPGGLLDQSVQVADIFLEKGVIVSTRGRMADQNQEFTAHTNGQEYSFPLVVLVNEGSASASEIVAGALQDHKRALILGAQTFGKGSVQTIIPMNDGAGLRLTTARYYTPNGTSIQAKGITPDVVVPSSFAESNRETAKQPLPHFLREKDLQRHMRNEDDVAPDNNEIDINNKGNDEMTPPEPDQSPPDLEDRPEPVNDGLEAITDEELARDRQLNSALIILQSLNILTPHKGV